MAKADLNKLFKSIHGRVGDLVFRQMPDGSIVVSIAPRKKRRASKAQKAYRQGTFRERTQWARWAQLAAGRPMITAYNLAIKDIAHPPVVHRILRRDGRILVQASDNVWVEGVRVTIQDEQGRLLEAGDAARQEKDWWEYLPQVEGGHITACAWDIPGNRSRLELQE